MLARTLVRIGLLVAVGYVAIGYASAYAQLEPVRDDAWAVLSTQHIVGHRLGAMNAPLKHDDLEARIAGPFLVEVNYLVPQGVEGTLFVRKYFVLPWKRTLRGTEEHRIPLLAMHAAPRFGTPQAGRRLS
jgi:hypothetical protein